MLSGLQESLKFVLEEVQWAEQMAKDSPDFREKLWVFNQAEVIWQIFLLILLQHRNGSLHLRVDRLF